jgi:hypothetical protein
MTTSALKIRVTIAQPFVVAGTPFSLTTTVENAHEEPVEILSFLYHIPYQMQWINDVSYTKAFEERRKARWFQRLFLSSPSKISVHAPGEVMTYGNLQERDQALMKLLPSQSMSYSFKAIVAKWLFVSGGELAFPGLIRYRYKEGIHFAPFEVSLVLRPPLIANGIGAIAGSILGSSARNLKDQGATFFNNIGIEYAAATVLATILAVIAVVYSSRRTGESQPILTVEDFWGGLIVGFMIGYLGHEFFQRLVPIH